MTRPLRVAIIGSGPAGIYAGNILKNQVAARGGEVHIDLFETLPAPYGLIRYGVAPDHPRIKGIVNSLHEMLDAGDIRLIGNVEVGRDISLDDLYERYDAVIAATGASRDAALNIPGVDLEGSYGAADFVSWFDGHPDVPRTWPLEAREIAVIGNGNVALDVARMLAKHVKDLMSTDIPANVAEGLSASPVTDVHVFGRRGPADVKFTPIELRELGEVPDVDTIVYDEDFAYEDELAASGTTPDRTNQVKVMVRTMQGWRTHETGKASRRLHLHFYHAPVAIEGDGKVEKIVFEKTEVTADGSVQGTGEFVEYPVQAVYRAVGYYGSPLPGAPFDERRGVIRNQGGRVFDGDNQVPGLYATGWIKRGPVGLIGHTKGDALETIENLIADLDAGALNSPTITDEDEIFEFLAGRGVEYTTWNGWLALDAHERALGASDAFPRERVKVVPREEQVGVSRAGALSSK
ncbi:MAG TPA: FAD-dependent oxidoreductase [Candidatus Lumbricidophila sp.]|nr:FAD-dependent oxidoreductase [Candidatus Lumbricidophila sp.]